MGNFFYRELHQLISGKRKFVLFFSPVMTFISFLLTLQLDFISAKLKNIYILDGKKEMGRNHKGVRATTERKAELWLPSCLMKSLEFSRGKCIGAVGRFIPGLTGILGALWLVKGHFSYLALSAVEGDSSQDKKNKYPWMEISF